jgi:ankyrin repeat protein
MLISYSSPDHDSGSLREEYKLLAAKLDMVSPAPTELDGASVYSRNAPTVSSLSTEDSDKIVIPSVSELAIDDGLIPVDPSESAQATRPMASSSMDPRALQVQEESNPLVSPLQQTPPSQPAQPFQATRAVEPNPTADRGKRAIIKVDRSKLTFRKPKSTAGSSSAALQNTLITAVENKKHKVAEQLLDRGVSPDTSPKNALLIATEKQDMDMLKLLLSFGADPNRKDANDRMPLRVSFHKDGSFATTLLEHGADPNIEVQKGWSALVMAMESRAFHIVRPLLQYGADPNYIDSVGQSNLVFACAHGHIEPGATQELIEWGADVNLVNKRKIRPLEGACASGRPEVVEILLKAGVNYNEKFSTSHSPLEWVCYNGKPDIAELLLLSGAAPTENPDALELAVRCNHMETVKLLLSKGFDVNHQSDNGNRTPLTTACHNNNGEIVKLLLSHGADPNRKGYDRNYPIFFAANQSKALKALLANEKVDVTLQENLLVHAAYWSLPEDVELILNHGGDAMINTQDSFFGYPINKAAAHDRWETFNILLRHGADVNIGKNNVPLQNICHNPKYIKALLDAGADTSKCPRILKDCAFHRQADTIRVLVEHGKMDVNTVAPDDKHTALTCAAEYSRDECLDLLIELGADPNLTGREGKSALWWAAGNPKAVEKLLAAGADATKFPDIIPRANELKNLESLRLFLNAGAKPTQNPNLLINAVAAKNVEAIKMLLDHGADINARDKESNFAVYKAVAEKNFEITELLINRGADINMAWTGYWEGWTPLMKACRLGDIDIARMLMKHGADVEAVTKDGKTPMDIAAENGHDEIVVLLLDGME